MSLLFIAHADADHKQARKRDGKCLVFVATTSNGICTCHVEIYRINVFFVESTVLQQHDTVL